MSRQTVGVIGAGGIAQVHVPGWLRLGFNVVVHSTDGQAPALTRRHGGSAVDSLEQLLDRCDIVDVLTPSDTHRDLVERAAAAGKHVVCEKPMALTVADCAAMIAACRRAGVRLFPAHVVRYFPAYTAMHEAVAAGRIGQPAVQRFFRMGAAPDRPWFLDRARSGGIAMDQMIHDFDQARWSAGEVDSVYATIASSATDVTTVQAILRHRSGTISHVNGVWGTPTLTFRSGFSVAGADGMLEHDSLRHPVLGYDGLSQTAGADYLPPVNPADSPYTAELADFARAIRDGDAARVSAEDGLQAVRIAAAVNRSTDHGVEIPLEEIR